MKTAEAEMQDADERLRRANERANRLETDIVEGERLLRLEKEERERIAVASAGTKSRANSQLFCVLLLKPLYCTDVWTAALEAAEERVAQLEIQLGQRVAGDEEMKSQADIVAKLQSELVALREENARLKQQRSSVEFSLKRESSAQESGND
jgi:hypothetical protein